ncbi:MAG: autotransporter-associated beta strand repeat-containing protein [Pirellulales bacterium]
MGTGTISLTPTINVTLQADATNRSVANAMNVGGTGNINFDSNGGGILNIVQGSTTHSTTLLVNANFNVASGATVAFLQPITGTGRSLTKSGAGTLEFGIGMTYSGGTTVNAGTLSILSAGALASGSNLTIGAAGTVSAANVGQSLGTVQVDGLWNLNAATGTTTVTTLNGLSTGDINFGSATTLSVSQSTTDYAGTIDGAGILTKTSANDLTLTSALSTYSGGTNLTNGSLTIGADSTASGTLTQGPIGIGTLNVSANTTINGAGAARTIHNAIGLNTAVTFGGTNQLYTNVGLTVPTQITMGANLALTVNTGVDIEFAKEITDGTNTFTLNKLGTGRLILSNADNTFTGAVTVSAGTLAVTSLETQTATVGTNADSLGNSNNTAASLTINGAVLQYLGSGSSTDRLFTVGASGATLDAAGAAPWHSSTPERSAAAVIET